MTGVTLRRAFAAICTAIITASLLQAAPASAQRFSDGYKFLEAVREKDGTEAIRLLEEPGSTVVNSRDITSGETGLHIAAARRDATWINFLAQRGANPNIRDKRGNTPLVIASQLGFIEGVEALVRAGARVDEPNSAGETPLISAVHARNIPMIRVLLNAGGDPDRSDNSGRTARDYAALRGEDNPLLAEIERNDEERAARGENGQSYGPNF